MFSRSGIPLTAKAARQRLEEATGRSVLYALQHGVDRMTDDGFDWLLGRARSGDDEAFGCWLEENNAAVLLEAFEEQEGARAAS
jgi:hypothetical protein